MIKIFFAALSVTGALYAAPLSHVVEDTYTLYALDAQMHQKPRLASGFFAELYKETANKEYLYQSLRMLEQANDTKGLSKSTAAALAVSPKDETLQRFEIIALIKGGKFSEASEKAAVLSDKTKKAADYLLYAESRLKLDDYEGAVASLKNAYDLSYDENTADRIALIKYAHLGEKAEAIKFLKDHIGAHGNSILIGKRLGSFYANSGAYDDAAQMYTQTYEQTSDTGAAEEAVKIYLYTHEYIKLTALLEKSGVNDILLLELYVREKQFAKASFLAQKLYEHENNPLFLAQSAVYTYEGADNKKDALLVGKVVDGLKKALNDLDDPLYLNYLGYLMIDHDLNVSEGMDYVRRALKKQPDSPFYLDSLAWGNYKLGECSEALRLMKQVESMIGTDEQEVKDHLRAIEECKTKEKN